MVILVKFTPDGRSWEASSEQADDEKSTRVYSGMALDTPQYWERNHYILTMTMLDTFGPRTLSGAIAPPRATRGATLAGTSQTRWRRPSIAT